MEKIEKRLDRFFGYQATVLWNALERVFAFIFRETEKGVFGLFCSPDDIRQAAVKAREGGYTNFDCLTPFPVHGLEFDMGLKRSRLPYITFFGGLLGLCIAFFLQTVVHEQIVGTSFRYFDAFPNFRSYPLNIGGKPSFSWPAMVPICFELTILLAGHSTVIGLVLVSRLYRPFRKVLHPDITQDKFCLWIPSDSENYKEEVVVSFLKEMKASEITIVGADRSEPITGASDT